jgi:xylan 1,4-beta-xylosidase
MKKIAILSLSLTLAAAAQAQTAEFDYFKYAGNDARFNVEIDKSHQYYNPVLAGFYPDPSLCRAGDTYYLVNSSFTFFPGVPLSTSKDLVNWQPAGHVLTRQSQVPLKGQHVSGGIFAPAISYNKKNKTFYMITTNVGAGNFFVKSKDPSKGWSEPIYLKKIDGIDPSFFFDDNGKGYIVHNGPVVGGADYEGQRSIRCFEFDVKGDSIKGDFKEILRGGTHVEARPIWIEGPHLFKKGKFYYLMCAEGGTGGWHSEVILRAKNPMGPWEECPNNPILTQRTGLDPNRKDPVSSAGHADIVEDGKGNWWAVFLACRPYEEDMYNTGRDTYLLPGNIYKREPMSAIWARQQHGTFTAETEINFTPRNDKDIAGLALLQKEDHNFVLGKTMKKGKLMITLTRAEKNNVTIASAPIKGGKLKLKVEGHDRYYDFYYAEEGGNWQLLAKGVDASNLSTQKSGGFLGACIGLYASSNKE